jgi:deoxyribodipyrimidine photolyase-related protein
MKAALIYPHQLYNDHPALAGVGACVLIEDPLFFRQYRFHAQKLLLHRLSMRAYEKRLMDANIKTFYVGSAELNHSSEIGAILAQFGIKQVQVVDPCDDWLLRRLTKSLRESMIGSEILNDPNFLTPLSEFEPLSSGRTKWYFTDFYVSQRKRLKILLDSDGRPTGGKWSFDSANRKKLPKGIQIPQPKWPTASKVLKATATEISTEFPEALGSTDNFQYPVTAIDTRACLEDFLAQRFENFGDFEDAIEPSQAFLFHSVLTPALNIGLISPMEVVQAALEHAYKVPINSLEGFIRQVIGWREYMRGVYHYLGRLQRTSNYWNHQRPLPSAFYDGTTGIEPVDNVIHRVLKHAYCHHIERLMVLGNFMLLCEICPDAIYRWFMEQFIDAYDWVMVPNVYGMSQFADGGLMTTKPYISGSAYILKMSSFKRGPWCEIWDALYWRFIDNHRSFFKSNPRMSVMVAQCDRMGPRLQQHQRVAEQFLERL